jgi:hypothetical protein
MSFADRLVLWLHIGFVIFTIGPLALAISSTPRYIRQRNTAVLRYLARITTILTVVSLGVLAFGIAAAQTGKHKDLGRPWLTAAMTLFVVSLVLLVMIIRDQRAAIRAVEAAPPADRDGSAERTQTGHPPGANGAAEVGGDGVAHSATAIGPGHVASVERGRIAAMGGVVNLIWLVILVLMVWNG